MKTPFPFKMSYMRNMALKSKSQSDMESMINDDQRCHNIDPKLIYLIPNFRALCLRCHANLEDIPQHSDIIYTFGHNRNLIKDWCMHCFTTNLNMPITNPENRVASFVQFLSSTHQETCPIRKRKVEEYLQDYDIRLRQLKKRKIDHMNKDLICYEDKI